MNKKQYIFLVILTIIASFTGGMFYNWLFAPKFVSAQATKFDAISANTISIRKIELVNEEGLSVGIITSNNDGSATLRFGKDKGQILLSSGIEKPLLILEDDTYSSKLKSDSFVIEGNSNSTTLNLRSLNIVNKDCENYLVDVCSRK
jgi:hypothetical protein